MPVEQKPTPIQRIIRYADHPVALATLSALSWFPMEIPGTDEHGSASKERWMVAQVPSDPTIRGLVTKAFQDLDVAPTIRETSLCTLSLNDFDGLVKGGLHSIAYDMLSPRGRVNG